MHHHSTIGARIAAIGSTMSPYPPSFDGSAWLYFVSLVSLMCIAMFSAVVAGWMARDLWRDRFEDHPKTLAFLFRFMVLTIAGVGFIRCLPEVAFMTCYGEVTGATMGRILAVKRVFDALALPNVILWMFILVLIYPFVMIALKSQTARATIVVDPLSVWHRLGRPTLIFITILVIASLMAAAKGSLGHHA